MNSQFGFITRTDRSETQNITVDAGLNGFLAEMHFSPGGVFGFPRDVSGFFLTGSANRSLLMMNYPCKEYVSSPRGSCQLPVYGVKGAVNISRVTNYTHLLTADEGALQGGQFFQRVFGTELMTADECLSLTENGVQQLFGRPLREVPCTLTESQTELAVRIAERLWAAQEADVTTRFVVLLRDAERISADVMRAVCLLLPQRLRLQMGFETNITRGDLAVVESAGLPLYLFTMERSEYTELGDFRFPVCVYDPEEADEAGLDEKYLRRRDLLRRLAQAINAEAAEYFAYMEKAVIDSHPGADQAFRSASFEYYEETVRAFLSPEVRWRMQKEQEQTIASLQKDMREQLGEKDAEMGRLRTQMQTANQKLEQSLRYNREMDEEMERCRYRLNRAEGVRKEELEEEIEDTRYELAQKKDELRKASGSSRLFKILTGIFAVLAAGAIAFSVIFFLQSADVKRTSAVLESENQEMMSAGKKLSKQAKALKAEREELTAANETLTGQVETLESEKEALTAEKEMLAGQVEALEAEKKAAEQKDADALPEDGLTAYYDR